MLPLRAMLRILDENILFENTKIGHSFRPENFAFIIVYKGSLTLEINGKNLLYEKGHIIIVSAKNLYKLIHISKDLKIYILSSNKESISRNTNININRYDAYRIANDETSINTLFYNELELDYLISQFKYLKDFFDSKSAFPFKNEIIWNIVSIIIYSVFGKLITNFNESSSTSTRKEEITLEFIRFVSKHFRNQKELQFYADQLHISVKYLSNTVREITKVPPTNFIADAIINEAKINLLDNTNFIKHIADELGFADQYSFGKFFKKHTGLSPKYYRLENALSPSF